MNPADYPGPPQVPHLEAFRDGLRELGYTEGHNLRIEYRFADLQFDELPRLAAELASLPVDVLVLADTRSIRPAHSATNTIPLVMVLSSDPVFMGNVASLARPGGNLTGLTMAPMESMGKRLELLRDAVPGLARAALLYNAGDRLGANRGTQEVAEVAAMLGIDYTSLPVRQPHDLEGAVQRAREEGVEGLVVWGDPLLNNHAERLATLAIAAGLPTIGMSREIVEKGLLMAYAPSLPALFHRAATYVDKIIRGTKPSDLPVERPARFELVLNLRTARALGLELAPRLLLQVTDVIN